MTPIYLVLWLLVSIVDFEPIEQINLMIFLQILSKNVHVLAVRQYPSFQLVKVSLNILLTCCFLFDFD